MISAHKKRDPKRFEDNYARLANYAAGGDRKSEKVLTTWPAGCWAGDDYELGILEAMDTQALNTRAKSDKTYHFIVSFRPEDEAKLTPEIYRVMEEEFAAALGLSEHQRHCGVHKNTNNLHMHVAYNLIHPEKLTIHIPFDDYAARNQVCRRLEQRYGLVVDNGIDPNLTPEQKYQRRSDRAAQAESHTGQQSFEAYAKSKHDAVMPQLEAAGGWRDVHEALSVYGLEIKPQGNGLVIKDRHGKHAVKASEFDRSMSMKKLESRFGKFASPEGDLGVTEQDRYQAAPLQRAPERGRLYAEYQAGIELRKSLLTEEKERKDGMLGSIQEKYRRGKETASRGGMSKKAKYQVLSLLRQQEREELAQAMSTFVGPASVAIHEKWAKERERITKQTDIPTRMKPELLKKAWEYERAEMRRSVSVADARIPPYKNWNEFLKLKTLEGNEVALAILRSTKERIKPEPAPLDPAERLGDLVKSKVVDNTGTLILTLASGGTIRDTGKNVFFSAHDKAAREAARQYAHAKWGERIHFEGNRITFSGRKRESDIQR